MITILNGTNRVGNATAHICRFCAEYLENKGVEVQVWELEQMPSDMAFNNATMGGSNDKIDPFVNQFMLKSDRMVIISPEYNGSFPGVLKTLIDIIPPATFKGRKVSLLGVAAGRAGNQRGLDHLTNILHYVGAVVHPLKTPISQLGGLLNDQGELTDDNAKQAIQLQLDEFLNY